MYELRGAELHCQRHNQTFGALSQCTGCFDDPLPPPTADEISDVDQQDIDDEKFCRDQRDFLISLARGQQERREDNESQDRIGAATIAKVFDTAYKWHRGARDARVAWRQPQRDEQLMRDAKELAGVGKPH